MNTKSIGVMLIVISIGMMLFSHFAMDYVGPGPGIEEAKTRSMVMNIGIGLLILGGIVVVVGMNDKDKK